MKNVKNIFLYITLFVIVINITLLAAKKLLMDNYIKTVNQSIITTAIPKDNKKIRQINKQIILVKNIQKEYIPWSRLLAYFSANNPEGVLMHSIVVTPDKKNEKWNIKLTGNTQTRESFLLLKENLNKKDSIFEDIEIPLDNLFTKNNIDFIINFNISKKNLTELPLN